MQFMREAKLSARIWLTTMHAILHDLALNSNAAQNCKYVFRSCRVIDPINETSQYNMNDHKPAIKQIRMLNFSMKPE